MILLPPDGLPPGPTCLPFLPCPALPCPACPQIQRHNLAPTLAWVREHETQLAGPGGQPSAFEFSIHRLAFLTLLKEQGQAAAVGYARQHFGPFQGSQMPAIQKLMGALCFSRRAAAAGGRPSPYADLLAEDLWGNLGGWVAERSNQQHCRCSPAAAPDSIRKKLY
jgi:hypothetical protein